MLVGLKCWIQESALESPYFWLENPYLTSHRRPLLGKLGFPTHVRLLTLFSLVPIRPLLHRLAIRNMQLSRRHSLVIEHNVSNGYRRECARKTVLGTFMGHFL